MKKILIGPVLFLSAFQAQANQTYIGLDVGFTRFDISEDVEDNAQYIANEANGSVRYEYPKGSGFSRLFLGNRVADNLEIEVGFFATSDIEATYSVISGVNSGAEIESTASVSGFDFGLNFFVNDNLYLRGGIHNATLTQETKGALSGESTDSGMDMLFGVGYKSSINDNVYLRTGYNRYNNLAGESSLDVNVFSLGLLVDF